MLINRGAVRYSLTVSEFEERFDHEDLYRLRIFDLIEPIGDVRFDVLIARLSAVIATYFSGENVSSEQFRPNWGQHLEKYIKKSAREIVQGVKALLGVGGVKGEKRKRTVTQEPR